MKTGTIINQYKIISAIGKGGMGEVYQAQDSKLGRKVALKILPSEFAEDKARMSRFVQEAQAAAALNHPHIAHVYEIGEADNIHYIAMEFVDGITLRDAMHKNKTDLKRLLKYMAQSAEGLAKAHAAGIVHRDLKPENIMISRDGYAKILDFGLAKLVESKEFKPLAEKPETEADTAIINQHSEPGMIMGTVGYMSPEQAEGKINEIDNRSDIFSFGCILFEAVTGEQPFKGDSVIKSLHKIIYEPAPPIKDLNPAAPGDLQRIVRRCLAKDPEERYQSIKDVAIELKEIRREMEGGAELDATVAPNRSETLLMHATESADSQPTRIVSTQPPAAPTQISSAEYLISGIRQNRKMAFLAMGVVGLIGVAVAFGLYRMMSGPNTTTGPLFEKTKITKLTKNGRVIHTAISPDGKYIAHIKSDAGKQTLLVRQASANNDIVAVPEGPAEYWGITFTPDSNDLFYITRELNQASVLYRIPALGGTPQRLMERLDSAVSFSPDGKQFAFVRGEFPEKNESVLMVANSDGTGEKVLASRKLPERFYPIYFTGPSWSPDGKTIAVSLSGFENGSKFKVLGVNVSDGKERDLTRESWEYIGKVGWLKDGQSILMIAREEASAYRQVWKISLTGGKPRQITSGFTEHRSLSLTSDSTRFVTALSDRMASVWVAPVSNIDQAQQISTAASEGIIDTSWTPDGRLAYSLDIRGGKSDMGIMNADGSQQKPLISNAGLNIAPQVSASGKYVVYGSTQSGAYRIWIAAIDGSNPKQLTDRGRDDFPVITPDERWVVYASFGPETRGLWKVSVDGGAPIRLTEGYYNKPVVSPDGKSIAALFLESANSPDARPDKIAILPIEGGVPLKTFSIQDSPTAGTFVRWSRDGRSIVYNQVKDNIANLWSQPIAGGKPNQISNFKEGYIYSFSFSTDGKQIAISRGNYTRDAILVTSGD